MNPDMDLVTLDLDVEGSELGGIDEIMDPTLESVLISDDIDMNVETTAESILDTTPKVKSASIQVCSGDDYFTTAPLCTSIGTRVCTADFQPRFMSFIEDERQLSTVTGINSFKTIDCIVRLVEIAFGPQLKHLASTKMNLYNRVIMTYMELKQNLSYSFLAVVFPCYTANRCKTVFYEMIAL